MSLTDDIRREILFVNEQRLRKLGACGDSRELFAEDFPEGVEISVEVCEAHANKYDWYWAGENFLSGTEQRNFKDAYNRAATENNKAYDHLNSLRYDGSGLLSEDEYRRLYSLNSANLSKNLARVFAEAVVYKAERAARTLVNRLRQLNDDELRYKVLFVTPERLESVGACDSQVELFRKQFREGAEITRELALVHRKDYDWSTAANLLLNEDAKEKYVEMEKAAYKVYNETTDESWNRYDRQEISEWQNTGIQALAEETVQSERAVAFAECAIGQYKALKAALAADTEEAKPETVNELPEDVQAAQEEVSEEAVSSEAF